jgi:hypothetical protein
MDPLDLRFDLFAGDGPLILRATFNPSAGPGQHEILSK